MKHHQYWNRHHSRVVQQGGFTLLELLVALGLVLVIVVSVQRYIAGVTVDHEGITARRDEATQTRIALSNMQRDVAQAGYFPYASGLNPTNLPLGVSTDGSSLTVISYQPVSTARDCRNADKFDRADLINDKLDKWVRVVNIYSVVDDSLSCNGNGSKYRASVLDDVEQMLVTNVSDNKLINVCIITSELATSIGGSPTRKMCDGTTAVPSNTNKLYYKIQADMPVYTSSFLAGQE